MYSQTSLECIYDFLFTPELQAYTTKPEFFFYFLRISYINIMHHDQIHLQFLPIHPPLFLTNFIYSLKKKTTKNNNNKRTTLVCLVYIDCCGTMY